MTSIYLGNQSVYDPLVLQNNRRINGVEHFYQTTKPTTRGDGSALVIGDRWWKTDDGTEWFWNGTYWLGEKQVIGIDLRGVNRDASFFVGGTGSGFFLHKAISVAGQLTSYPNPPNWDQNNYRWFAVYPSNSSGIGISGQYDPLYRITTYPKQEMPINIASLSSNFNGINLFTRTVGSPTDIQYTGTSSINVIYSIIAP